jgi:glycosyltransferase involved in cell wall biosynthesis
MSLRLKTKVPAQEEKHEEPVSRRARLIGLVMTYNQQTTIIESVNSLLNQTLELDLIIVSDDHSTDGTYELIQTTYSKSNVSHRVKIYQTDSNLGFIPHFNSILETHFEPNDLIFYNAGDDISEPSRVREFSAAYLEKKKPRYFLGHSYVTSFGGDNELILVPPIESIKKNAEILPIASAYHIGASQVFTGALFFDFGPILFDECYEDLTLGYRAILQDAYCFIPKTLVRYRTGGLSSWKKNSLEKKRSRLKYTLVQRAIDAMRAGNYEPLSTIHDCYSQYGFALKPHRERIDITIVTQSEYSKPLLSYSVSNYFEIFKNICNPRYLRACEYINERRGYSFPKTNQLFWLVLAQMDESSIRAVIALNRHCNGRSLVLDTGLNDSTDALNQATEFLSSLTLSRVHSSSVNLSNRLKAVFGSERLTYVPPLLHVDGPDRKLNNIFCPRGLIVMCDESLKSRATLSIINNVCSLLNHESITLEVLPVNRRVGQALFAETYSGLRLFATPDTKIDIHECDFLVIINDSEGMDSDLVRYLWLLAAQSCIPTILDSQIPQGELLQHGKSCIFVDSEARSWSTALDLVLHNYSALAQIAIEARKRAYFECSVQKRVIEITAMLAKHIGSKKIYDKFLPL